MPLVVIKTDALSAVVSGLFVDKEVVSAPIVVLTNMPAAAKGTHMRTAVFLVLRVIDVLVAPLVIVAAFLLKSIRVIGMQRLPVSRNLLVWVGVVPIRDHYYEPLFGKKHLRYPLSQDRNLPGIDWNVSGQLEILKSFHYNQELEKLSRTQQNELEFYFENSAFESGDADFWYNLIRHRKPKRIIEIGSGQSTKMARIAITANQKDDARYACQHICIEPYEAPWLEKIGVSVVRKKVEEVGKEMFMALEANDILFIDSSHVIRPQGDVLFEYLELLPILKKGVIVHIHDIFSPRDYLASWVLEHIRFWNEQYLLESFLTSNKDWKILGALNYLHHNHFESLKAQCPFLTKDREPGSFYIEKVS